VPAHVVLVTIGSAGDLFPFLRMALALRAAGHPVSFLGPWLHEPYVRRAGLPFHGLPADAAVLDDPDLWHPRRGFGVVWRATRPAMAEVPRFVDALPPGERCVLLVHPLAVPEADLCRATRPGLKVAAAYLAPSNLPTVHDPLMMGPLSIPRWVPLGVRGWLWRRLGAHLIDPLALPEVNAARRARALAPVGGLLEHIVAAPDLSVLLFPDWFGPDQPDWPRPRYRTGFPLHDPEPDAALSTELSAFLAAGDRPVVFTPGTGNRQAAHYFRCAQAAAGRLGRRAIFLTAHREQVAPALPANVLWQEYVPLRALLPFVDGLVHHGGIGTTAEALRAGVPQLVVPLAHDQFDNAARVEALGTGRRLDASRLTERRLVDALRPLLDSPALRERCRGTAARFAAQAGFDGLAAALEALPG
jgi:rhamnosyltransferase subunit B